MPLSRCIIYRSISGIILHAPRRSRDVPFLETLSMDSSIDFHRKKIFSSLFLFSFLLLAKIYMYIFRLTMRDLFNGRESGNGIRTWCSWEPFRSALVSSSFAACRSPKCETKKNKTASITEEKKEIYHFFFLFVFSEINPYLARRKHSFRLCIQPEFKLQQEFVKDY